MTDPVCLVSNGHVYDRYAIDNYIKNCIINNKILKDPITNEIIVKNYLDCSSLKYEIQQYIQYKTEFLNKKKSKL